MKFCLLDNFAQKLYEHDKFKKEREIGHRGYGIKTLFKECYT